MSLVDFPKGYVERWCSGNKAQPSTRSLFRVTKEKAKWAGRESRSVWYLYSLQWHWLPGCYIWTWPGNIRCWKKLQSCEFGEKKKRKFFTRPPDHKLRVITDFNLHLKCLEVTNLQLICKSSLLLAWFYFLYKLTWTRIIVLGI